MTDPRTGGDPEPEQEQDTPVVGLAAKADVDMEKYRSDEGYDFDAAFAEAVGEPYRFRWSGTWWELPHILCMDRRSIGKFNALANLGETNDLDVIADRVGEVIRAAFGDQAEAFDKTPQPPLKVLMLFNQWKDHSGVDVGEASSSNGSSGSTAERSKRTSRGTTKSGSTGRSTAARKTGTRRASSSR